MKERKDGYLFALLYHIQTFKEAEPLQKFISYMLLNKHDSHLVKCLCL